jgi:hypothetical protein
MSGTSRTEAGVWGATRLAGVLRRPRESCARTRIRPAAKATSSQTRPSLSEDAQAAAEDRRDHQPIARRVGAEQSLDLLATGDTLPSTRWPRALVWFQLLDWIGNEPPAPPRIAQNALKGRQRVR